MKLIDRQNWKRKLFGRFLSTSFFAFASAAAWLIFTLFQDDYSVTHYRIYDNFNDRYFGLMVSIGAMFLLALYLRSKTKPVSPPQDTDKIVLIFLYLLGAIQILFGLYCLLQTYNCIHYGFGHTDFQ